MFTTQRYRLPGACRIVLLIQLCYLHRCCMRLAQARETRTMQWWPLRGWTLSTSLLVTCGSLSAGTCNLSRLHRVTSRFTFCGLTGCSRICTFQPYEQRLGSGKPTCTTSTQRCEWCTTSTQRCEWTPSDMCPAALTTPAIWCARDSFSPLYRR